MNVVPKEESEGEKDSSAPKEEQAKQDLQLSDGMMVLSRYDDQFS